MVSAELLPAQAQQWITGWNAVTVLGTAHLGGLPPAALRLADGGWLGAEFAVDAVPSLTLALELERRAPPARERATQDGSDDLDLVLFAALDPGPAALERWAGLEARAVDAVHTAALTGPFSGRDTVEDEASLRARVLLREQVTRAGVMATPLAEIPLVHFLVHGIHLRELERQAALVLAGDADEPELLTCADVESALELSGVVLLSACATARGPGRPGDDSLAHLGGAFLVAGARAVVLAQSPVELDVTLGLMQIVHQRLGLGDSPAEAMRVARAAALTSSNALEAYVAAQYSVIGLGHEPVFVAAKPAVRSETK